MKRQGILIVNYVQKIKLQSEIKKIMKTNNAFSEWLLTLNNNYHFQTGDGKNLLILNEHLINMNVIFNNMQERFNKK